MKKHMFKTIILVAILILMFSSQAFAAMNEVEPNNDMASATPIELNQPYTGSFNPDNVNGDDDHFVFSLDETSVIQVEVQYQGELPPGMTVIVIDNSDVSLSGWVIDESLFHDGVTSPWYSKQVSLAAGDYTLWLGAGLYTSDIIFYPYEYTVTVIKEGGEAPPPGGAVGVSAWAADEVNEAIFSGLVLPSLQSDYQSNITRAEFCSLIVTMIQHKTGLYSTDLPNAYGIDLADVPFSDAADGSYYDIDIAYGLGIVNGFEDGTFRPSNPITRQEAAAMLRNAAAFFEFTANGQNIPDFSDKANIGAWAMPAVNFVASHGIMGGVGDNKFSPQTYYTREQSIITSLRLFDALIYGGY